MDKIIGIYFCETAIVDSRTNQLSLISIFEELALPALPAVLAKISLVIILENGNPHVSDSEDTPITIEIYNNDKKLYEQHSRIKYLGKTYARLIMQLNGLPIREVGQLTITTKTSSSTEKKELPIKLLS
ncbi:DUF6941 family protein [Leptospira saintgironsiae]|uniref:Uncharacterized protein n=1 Tax=Leptospira saintgironsiae TaxID=2023183 RepID=A0A2M9Y7D4_9LEPT|nr:hypothetical protein [Leptospira saintgironsiae]PJZ47474.1 hypothetical protein CH362_19000 [Leptospira saintgironsiae]